MITQRDQRPVSTDSAGKEVKARGPIEVMTDIVLARPEELHGDADFLRDPRRLDHVVVGEPAAEAAASAREVDRDVFFFDA